MLQRASTWLILCLSFYLSSCRQDVQVLPNPDEEISTPQTLISESASEAEINSIQEWFNNLPPVSSSQRCSNGLTFHPRWDKSKKGSERTEFEIFENVNKIAYPKMKDVTNAKQGRKRFVTKEKNNNGNGNGNNDNGNNRQGHIVSFIPSNTFTGNMDNVTTSTFRGLQFDGIIMFEELSGCFGAAYWVKEGVVMKRLEIQTVGSVTGRCGYTAVAVDWYTGVSAGGNTTYSYDGPGTIYTYVGCLEIGNGVISYDATMAQSQSVSGSPVGNTDPYYDSYLEPNTVNSKDRICPLSFTYQLLVDM